MKKIIGYLMVVAVLLSCMTLTAFAAVTGDTVTVSFSTSGNPGFASYGATLNYDHDALELVSCEAGPLSAGGFAAYGDMASFFGVSDVTGDGVLFTATFKIRDGAAAGTYPVTATLDNMSTSNAADDYVTFGIVGGSVTVEKPACNHVWDEGKVTKEATCTENGVKTYTCTVSGCGETMTETINAIGHKWGEWTETKAPTCTEAGEKTRVCANDASHKETDEIAATGHKWNDGEVTTAAGCETTGVKTFTCTVDGCGATKTEEIPANGHNYGEWKETKAPTCTEKGEETRECACGKTETREVEAKGHALNSYGKDATHHWALCDNCDHVGAKEAHSHDYNGVCVCGAKKPVVDDPNLDDVPKTGDITPYIAMSVASIIALAAAAAFVLKRKAVK